jgi:hypothetical protein
MRLVVTNVPACFFVGFFCDCVFFRLVPKRRRKEEGMVAEGKSRRRETGWRRGRGGHCAEGGDWGGGREEAKWSEEANKEDPVSGGGRGGVGSDGQQRLGQYLGTRLPAPTICWDLHSQHTSF